MPVAINSEHTICHRVHGKVVGVAFETARGLENTGYFIPMPVVQHFLKDAADGSYDGFPTLGVHTATMLSEAARRAAWPGANPGSASTGPSCRAASGRSRCG